MGIQSDFLIVESMGRCFLCLNEIPCPIDGLPINPEPSSDSPSSLNYSLQSLSRYLKMDVSEAFSEKEYTPQYLLASVRESKLKVELCRDCASINDNFTELYRQLEIIEMKVVSSLNLVYGKLINSEGALAKTEKLKKLAEFRVNSSGWKRKLGILEVLRTEAIHTCARKLNTAPPRVNIKNMTIEEINNRKLEFERETSSDRGSDYCSEDPGEFDIGNVKVEEEEHPSVAESDEDAYDFSDSINPNKTTESIKITVTTAGIKGEDTPSSSDIDLKRERKQEGDKLPYVKITPSDPPSFEKSKYSLNPATGKYKCTHCSRDFTRTENVHAHYRNVHLKMRYKCKLCGKEFASSSACSRHVQSIHIGVRFECYFCKKSFRHKHHLTDHQRTICGAGMVLGPS